MSNVKTLIIFSPGFPANETDSTCMPFPQLFVKKLKQLHPELNIIVLAFQYPFTAAEYEWNDVHVIAFGGRNKGKLLRLWLWKKIRKKAGELIRKHNVAGILNFWLGEASLLGEHAGRKYNLPSYTWLLGQDVKAGNKYFSRIKPEAKFLIALSDAVADELYKNYKIFPQHIIPPGTEEEITVAAERDIDIIGAGSLIPLKQYDIFIRVIAALKIIKPDIVSMICGDGPQKDHLEKLITAKGLENNIKLCGELKHSRVSELMHSSKILLHPSSSEGFATVVSEALAAGTHIIAFTKPMKADFLHQHIVADEEEMINKTIELLSGPLPHDPVIPYRIEDTCEKILSLYQ